MKRGGGGEYRGLKDDRNKYRDTTQENIIKMESKTIIRDKVAKAQKYLQKKT